MNLLVVGFLAVLMVAGYGFTYFFDPDLDFEERVLYGVVVGTIVTTLSGFGFAWWVGMSRGSVMVATAFTLALSGPGWRLFPGQVRQEWADFRGRLVLPVRDAKSPAVLLAILAVGAVVSIRILDIAYGTSASGGISAGHLSTFGDWSAHLAYAGSFVYADNYPPELPTAAGESFAYHFGIDFFSAMFVPLGTTLQRGLQLSSGLLAIAFPGVMFVAARRFTASRLAAALGVLVFLAAGGTAALYRFVVQDLPQVGITGLGDLPRSYAFDGFQRNWVDNPVTGFLYPQRPTLVGFPAVLMGLALLWRRRDDDTVRTHFAVGVLTGLLPIFHVFAFGVLFVMAAAWTLLEKSRRWLWFHIPALVLGLPVVLWQIPSNGSDGHQWHLGWMLGISSWEQTVPDFFWFWFLNTGFFIPLVVLGLWGRQESAVRFAPIFGLLLIPNVAIWHFWPGNNAKYVTFFLLLGAPFVGTYLAGWFRRGSMHAIAALAVLVTLTLSGGLDVWRAFEGSSGAFPTDYMSGEDVLIGEWVRERTAPHAVFAVANNNVHPVRAIAGRSVLSGSAGRLSDLGVDWAERESALRTLYGVNEGFDDVIAEYGIDYLVLGPEERRSFKPADAGPDWDPAQFWDAAAPLVYDVGAYKIYDVSKFKT